MLMIRGKTRPFWGQDTSSLGAEYYYSRIMLSAYLLLPHLLSTYLLFPHYAQCLPIIAAFAQCLYTYYSRIMLNAFWYLLFSKLCQHYPPNPSQRYIRGLKPRIATACSCVYMYMYVDRTHPLARYAQPYRPRVLNIFRHFAVSWFTGSLFSPVHRLRTSASN